MSVFSRFKEKQELRRVAELAEKLADRIPASVIRAAFPEEIDTVEFRNKLLFAAGRMRAMRNSI